MGNPVVWINTMIISFARSHLEAKKIEDALEPQEASANALAEAREIAQEQLAKLNKLQALIGGSADLASSTSRKTSGMADQPGTGRDQ